MKKTNILIIAVVIILCGYLLPVVLITVYKDGTYDASSNVDNIIILGAQIINDEPGPTLNSRLDKAIEIVALYPDATIYVTGGQGSDELYFESTIMKQYLVEKGVTNVIIEENQATSTYENLIYIAEMIDTADDNLVVTSNYHQYRTNFLCKRAELNCQTIESDYQSLKNYFYREPMAIYKSWLLDH